MAVRRGAVIGQAEYGVYSEDLEAYDIRDIASACTKIGLAPIAKGEMAFPDMGTLVRAVQTMRDHRCPARNPALADYDREVAEREANPDNFINMKEDPDFKALFSRAPSGAKKEEKRAELLARRKAELEERFYGKPKERQ